MTVANNSTKILYDGNGVATTFPIIFAFNEPANVVVMLIDGAEGQILTTGYYIDTDTGGNSSVIYPGYPPGEAPPSSEWPPVLAPGQKLIIYRETEATQERNIGDQGVLDAIERMADKNTMLIQELGEKLERTIIFPISENFSPELPAPIPANASIKINEEATGLTYGADPDEALANSEQANSNSEQAIQTADEALRIAKGIDDKAQQALDNSQDAQDRVEHLEEVFEEAKLGDAKTLNGKTAQQIQNDTLEAVVISSPDVVIDNAIGISKNFYIENVDIEGLPEKSTGWATALSNSTKTKALQTMLTSGGNLWFREGDTTLLLNEASTKYTIIFTSPRESGIPFTISAELSCYVGDGVMTIFANSSYLTISGSIQGAAFQGTLRVFAPSEDVDFAANGYSLTISPLSQASLPATGKTMQVDVLPSGEVKIENGTATYIPDGGIETSSVKYLSSATVGAGGKAVNIDLGFTWLDVTGSSQLPPWTKLNTGTAYEICEFYDFRHPTLKEGFVVRNGGLYEDADVNYPEAWEYLQTEQGQLVCVTESEWQVYSSTAGGIGGVPWFVIDTEEKSIRVPDTRGDFSRSEGFGGQSVGEWQGDATRNIIGSITSGVYTEAPATSGAFYAGNAAEAFAQGTAGGKIRCIINMDASRTVPTAAENRPRNYAVLGCVYLGG